MKHLFIASLLLLMVVFMPVVFIQTTGAQEQTVSEIITQDLGVENPGILPTNPFYFFKKIKRIAQRIFTIDPVKKAELEMNIINEQAAEIKKMEEVAPERVEAITKAAKNYQENVERLNQRLDNIKGTSQNPNIDKLVEKITDNSIKHQQLFSELKTKFEDNKELKDKIEIIQEKVGETAAKIQEKFDNSEMFRERLERIIKNQPNGIVNELKQIEIIDRISEQMPIEQRQGIEAVKENLIKNLGNKIENIPQDQIQQILKPEFLEMIPGDVIQRIRIVEELKSKIESPEIKEKLMEARTKILENKIENLEIRKEEVEKMINYVKELIVKVENAVIRIEDENIKANRKKILEKIKSRLAEAEKVLKEEKIGEAFDIANSVGAEVKKLLISLVESSAKQLLQEPNINSQQIESGIRQIESGIKQIMPIKPQIMPIKPEADVETGKVLENTIMPVPITKPTTTPSPIEQIIKPLMPSILDIKQEEMKKVEINSGTNSVYPSIAPTPQAQ